jgi:hypothetical protein
MSTTFSGSFKTVQTGKPDKNISYNGSIENKKGKMSFDIETDVNGAKKQIKRENVTMMDLRTDPEVLLFMGSLKGTKAKKNKKNKTKRASL